MNLRLWSEGDTLTIQGTRVALTDNGRTVGQTRLTREESKLLKELVQPLLSAPDSALVEEGWERGDETVSFRLELDGTVRIGVIKGEPEILLPFISALESVVTRAEREVESGGREGVA